MRTDHHSYKRLVKDMEALGLRHWRGHDLRRTMISLARTDGARKVQRKKKTPARLLATGALLLPVEAAGIEPASGSLPPFDPTCVVRALI